jgi:hypothetical protein
MPASYSTGSATSPVDLLQKLVTWLVAQGWTQDMSQAVGSGWRAHLHKAGQYVNLRAAIGEYDIWYYDASGSSLTGSGIGLYLGDGFSSGSAWNAQSGGPVQSGTSNVIGAGMYLPAGAVVAYHFFDDGADHVTVVVEKTAGVFVHMGWGPSLAKTGYTSDWWYFYASTHSYYNLYSAIATPPGIGVTAAPPMVPAYYYPSDYGSNAFVRVDAAIFASRWVGLGDGTDSQYGYTGRQGRSALDVIGYMSNITEIPAIGTMQDRGWQSAFTGALLLPLHVFVQATTGRWIPAGYPPTVFHCVGVGHGFAAGAVYQVGGLDYMLFPNFAVRKAA